MKVTLSVRASVRLKLVKTLLNPAYLKRLEVAAIFDMFQWISNEAIDAYAQVCQDFPSPSTDLYIQIILLRIQASVFLCILNIEVSKRVEFLSSTRRNFPYGNVMSGPRGELWTLSLNINGVAF